MNKRSLSLILSFALICFVSGMANAQCQNQGRGRGPGFTQGCMRSGPGQNLGPLSRDGLGSLQNVGKYVDLSPKQRQKMHDIRFSFMKKQLDFKEKLTQKKLERKTLMEKEPINWEKVDQLTDKMAMIKADMEKLKMRQRVKIKAILTPEQLEKLKNMFSSPDQNQPGFQDKKGFGPGRGRGRGMGMGRGMGHGPGRGMGFF